MDSHCLVWMKSSSNGTWIEGTGKIDEEKKLFEWNSSAQNSTEEDSSISLKVDRHVHLKKVPFGLKRFAFELENVQFATAKDSERQALMDSIFQVVGHVQDDLILNGKENSQRNGKVADLQKMLQNLPGGTNLGLDAAERLQQKLNGRVQVQQFSENKCLVCERSVASEEKVELNGGNLVHQSCFFCSSCAANLTPSQYGIDNFTLFCPCCLNKKHQSAKEENDRTLDHSAVLARPKVKRPRRRPTTNNGSMKKEYTAEEMASHSQGFHIRKSKVLVLCFCPSLAEKKRWVNVLSNTNEVVNLKKQLEDAQRVDMLSAIQAQFNIDAFVESHQLTLTGSLKICIRKAKQSGKWIDVEATLGDSHELCLVSKNKTLEVLNFFENKHVLLDAKTQEEIKFTREENQQEEAEENGNTSIDDVEITGTEKKNEDDEEEEENISNDTSNTFQVINYSLDKGEDVVACGAEESSSKQQSTKKKRHRRNFSKSSTGTAKSASSAGSSKNGMSLCMIL